jgi:hypothetical protein
LSFAAQTLRLGKQIQVCESRTEKGDLQKRKSIYMYALTFSATLTGLALLIIGIFWSQGVFDQKDQVIEKTLYEVQSRIFHQLTGSLVQPFTSTGVEGVDIASDDQSIRTTISGKFGVSDYNTARGLKVTHPNLRLPLIVYAQEEKVKIPFNVEAYNALVEHMLKAGEMSKNTQELKVYGIEEIRDYQGAQNALKVQVGVKDGQVRTYILVDTDNGWGISQ